VPYFSFIKYGWVICFSATLQDRFAVAYYHPRPHNFEWGKSGWDCFIGRAFRAPVHLVDTVCVLQCSEITGADEVFVGPNVNLHGKTLAKEELVLFPFRFPTIHAPPQSLMSFSFVPYTCPQRVNC
jgi:hypothetical protein